MIDGIQIERKRQITFRGNSKILFIYRRLLIIINIQMDQNLYFQRHHQNKAQSNSFFSCLDCNFQPQEIYIERAQNGKKILHTNIYLEPNQQTQDGFSYTNSGISNDMISSKKSVTGRQSRKVSISERVSRKSIQMKPHNNGSQNSAIIDSSRRQSLNPIQSINITRMVNSNGSYQVTPQPEFRFSTNENPYRNSPNQMTYSICTPIRQSKPVLFNYQNTQQKLPVSNQIFIHSNQKINNGKIQRKESVSQSILLGNRESVITEKQGEGISGSKISQFYQNKQILQSIELQQSKKLSDRIMSPQKMRKKQDESKQNFGHGRLNLKIRQTVSIKESEQDELHESFVLNSSNNSNNEFIQKLRRPFLKPITESQLELDSFIDPTNGGHKRF